MSAQQNHIHDLTLRHVACALRTSSRTIDEDGLKPKPNHNPNPNPKPNTKANPKKETKERNLEKRGEN